MVELYINHPKDLKNLIPENKNNQSLHYFDIKPLYCGRDKSKISKYYLEIGTIFKLIITVNIFIVYFIGIIKNIINICKNKNLNKNVMRI